MKCEIRKWETADAADLAAALSSQIPRSKLMGHQNSSAASCGVFDPRGSRQMYMHVCPLGSLLRGNKKVQDNLRDGLPYPYTEQDGENFFIYERIPFFQSYYI